MWTLIDGYNLMHAAGLMNARFTPERFRKVRLRFLNTLASKLPPTDAALTTIVFDARPNHDHLPSESRHKGMTVVFAIQDEDADSRIEDLIARHPQPRKLRVVSSDRRIREAARRRKAQSLTSEQFLDLQDRRPSGLSIGANPAPTSTPQSPPYPADRDHWLREFGHLDDDPDLAAAFDPDPNFLPTDADLARIAREVAQEAHPSPRRR